MGILSSLFGGNTSKEKQTSQADKNFDTLKYDGIRARNMRQLPYAIKCFENAIQLKEEPETMTILANAYLQTDQIEKARKLLDRLAEIQPEHIQTLLSLAQICYMQADYEAMAKNTEQAIRLDENNASAYYLAGQAYRGLGNPFQAISMLTKAIAQREEFIEAYQLRAEILWDMRQAKDALDDLEHILSLHAEAEDALLLKGKVLAGLGQAEEAAALFTQVTEINPFNDKAYLLKGGLAVELKKLDEAIGSYNEAIELMPNDAKLYQERGRVKLLMGDKDGSVADMKKAIELDPEKEHLITGRFDNSK